MYWVNFLHIYQPADQSKEILKRVVNESYRPLFKGFLKLKKVKINLNINGALVELLAANGYRDVIETIKKLADEGKLEFAESAMYHPLLPFLKEEEIFRQVEKNRETNKRYFKSAYRPVCFFPPEIAYSPNVAKAVAKLGYPMILLDEISYNGGKSNPSGNELFFIKGADNLLAVFRERRISNSIMSAIIRTKKEFIDLVKEEVKERKYFCTAMDGETFGHHRPEMEKNLFKLLTVKNPKQIFFSELMDLFPAKRAIEPVSATWASSREDIEKGIQFYSWKDPKNKVHQLQWRFLDYLRKIAGDKELSLKEKDRLDKAVSSDQFFWASGEPWWSVEMIEKGAWTILEALRSLPGAKKEEIEKGEKYYRDILATAFWWQRSGKIEERSRKYKEAVKVPFKERTLEVGGVKVYKTVLSLIRKRMLASAKKKNYERAILWRDAIWKLEMKNDIYDLMHAVDLLRIDLPGEFKKLDPQLNELFEKYKRKHEKIKSGQPEPRKI